MRKLYWWCLGGGVLLLAGVVTAAQIAVTHPQSFVGRAVFTATQLAAYFNPVAGFGQPAERCCPARQAVLTAEEPAEVCEPDCGEGQRPSAESGVVVEPVPEGAISIPEEEPIPPAAMPVGPEESCPVQVGEPGVIGPECPPGDRAGAAPLTMPYCCEEECEEACEKLPMPRVEGDGEEEQEEADAPCPLGGVHQMLRLFEKMLKKAAPGDRENRG
jgi:hypothetical protein